MINQIFFFIYYIIIIILTLIPVILSVAFYVLFERKIIGTIQRRTGPLNIGLFGSLQTFADAFKSLSKEIIIPFKSNFFLFLISPIFSFFISLFSWIVIPFNYHNFFIDFNYSALLLFVINSFGVYSIILPGLSLNSKYTLLGSFRGLVQFISYEIILSFIFLFIILITSSLSLLEIVFYQQLNISLFIPLFPVFIIFFISILAETNRSPFDLPEAESELVSGYSTEYSAITYVFFFFSWIFKYDIMEFYISFFFFRRLNYSFFLLY